VSPHSSMPYRRRRRLSADCWNEPRLGSTWLGIASEHDKGDPRRLHRGKCSVVLRRRRFMDESLHPYRMRMARRQSPRSATKRIHSNSCVQTLSPAMSLFERFLLRPLCTMRLRGTSNEPPHPNDLARQLRPTPSPRSKRSTRRQGSHPT